MPLGTEVDLGPGHIVLDGNPATRTHKMGHSSPPLFGLCLWPRSPISATAELLLTDIVTWTNAYVFKFLTCFRHFSATVCKTVLSMLSERCLSCLSVCPVCDVGLLTVLRPNGWMDQDETWRGVRPGPCPYCVRWGPSSPPPKGHCP